MRRHINPLINHMRPEPSALPCRREAVDVLRQVPVLDGICIVLHNDTNGNDFLALKSLGVLEDLADGTAEDVPDGV